MHIIAIAVGVGVGVWALSFLVEALRPAPAAPAVLGWAPNIPIAAIDVHGVRLRYIRAGFGPTVVLLHTLRTQLDLFQKVVVELSNYFTVYALDYSGHGYSDIPEGLYDASFFVRSVGGFLDALDLHDATLCGVSIGGAAALILAGQQHPRVGRVVAINPYDYGKGRGMARSSRLGWMITVAAENRLVGPTIMRLRNFVIMKAVLEGGVANPSSIPPGLLEEMYAVGNRSGHYRGFIQLLRNAASWEDATESYQHIRVPVRIVWGDKDWSTPEEREHDSALIPGAHVTTIENGGHFLPLDRPDAVIREVRSSVGESVRRA